jgi:hypothetical protein
MKSLTLSPTSKPGVSQVCLSDGFSHKTIGSYNEASKTFTAHRNEAKHLHRNTNSLAINEAVLNELPIRWIEISYTDSSGRVQRLATSKDYILTHGKEAAYGKTGFEKQIFLPLPEWSMEKAIRFEKQRNAQLSLFETTQAA